MSSLNPLTQDPSIAEDRHQGHLSYSRGAYDILFDRCCQIYGPHAFPLLQK